MTHLPPTPYSGPPFGAETDEAVSALLDDELGGFAAARGIEEAEALARLEAWSGLGSRLEELRRARLEVAGAHDLDERTRRRLVDAALTARDADVPPPARTRDHHRHIVVRAVAAVAAVVVVVALAVVLVGRDGDGGRQADSAASGGSAAAAPRGFLGDVGDVTDPAALRRLLGRATVSTTAPAKDEAARAAEPTAAIERCASGLSDDASLRFTATATSGGEPAYVIGITRDGRTIAFVVDASDCSIVGSVSR